MKVKLEKLNLVAGWLFCFTVYQPFLGQLKPN